MPRRKRLRSKDFPIFIKGRQMNREWFGIPLPEIWTIFEDHLFLGQKIYNVRLHSFCLLKNHYFLILSDPDLRLSEFMHFLQNRTSFRITRRAGRINQTYLSRYSSCVLSSQEHFLAAYKYVYREPVETNLCKSVFEYPFSTLRGLFGFERLMIPIVEDPLMSNSTQPGIDWISKSYGPKVTETIRKALKKQSFKLAGNFRNPRIPESPFKK
jgi:REP element-mobilizing transposase RayT